MRRASGSAFPQWPRTPQLPTSFRTRWLSVSAMYTLPAVSQPGTASLAVLSGERLHEPTDGGSERVPLRQLFELLGLRRLARDRSVAAGHRRIAGHPDDLTRG